MWLRYVIYILLLDTPAYCHDDWGVGSGAVCGNDCGAGCGGGGSDGNCVVNGAACKSTRDTGGNSMAR